MLALLALSVIGCASDQDASYVERPVGELYNEAMDAIENGDNKTASGLFEEVERQHPYSPWATKGQVMAAYAYYQANQYDDAIAAIDRFVRLHPANREVPYALYLKGLGYYERISDVGRDQLMTDEARAVFQEVVRRYPESPYARDAKFKLDLIHDHLAGKEMVIGRYYLRGKHYLAAINRFLRVVEDYQTTSHVPEALHRLVEAYTALGLDDEARKMAAVLGHNFPGSEWYIDAYEVVENESIRPKEKPWYVLW